jgi:hypothetical protein
MKIKAGENEVIYSGTVVSILNEPIVFDFPKEHASLRFIMNFVDDRSDGKSQAKFNAIDAKTMEILFVNFARDLGTGNTNLLHIGHINGRKLYFNYRIYSIKSISNTLHYTFYLGKEEKNAK